MSDGMAVLRAGARQRVKASAKEDNARLFKQREKGLWNFLTWSFFLSQVIAAEQAAAGSAELQAIVEDADAGKGGAAGPGMAAVLSPPDAGVVSDRQEAAPADAVTQVLTQDVGIAPVLATVSADIVAVAKLELSDDASGLPPNSAEAYTAAATLPMAEPATPETDLTHANAAPGMGDLPPGLVGGMETTPSPIVEQIVAPVAGVVGDVIEPLQPIVDQAVAPVLNIVGDAVQSLDPVVDQVVAPVLNIVGDVVQVLDPVVDQVVAPVLNIVGDVVQSLDPVVDQVVAPVAEIVGDLVQTIEPVVDQLIAPIADFTGDVVHLVEPVMQQVVAPVVDVAGDVVQVLDPVVEQVVAPVFDVLSDVVQPVIDQVAAPLGHLLGDPLTSLLGLGQGDAPPIVTTPIAAASGSVSGLHLDDLFSGGGYTEYGLALQSVISGPASPAPQSGATSPSVADDHMAASANDGHHDDGHGHTQSVGLPSVLEELGLRGLGDGISL